MAMAERPPTARNTARGEIGPMAEGGPTAWGGGGPHPWTGPTDLEGAATNTRTTVLAAGVAWASRRALAPIPSPASRATTAAYSQSPPPMHRGGAAVHVTGPERQQNAAENSNPMTFRPICGGCRTQKRPSTRANANYFT